MTEEKPKRDGMLEDLLLSQSLLISNLTGIILSLSEESRKEGDGSRGFLSHETENNLKKHLNYLTFMTNAYLGIKTDD